jgi:NAD(P)H-flavin reductase
MPSGAQTRQFYPARLLGREDAGGGLVRMTLEAGFEVLRTHASPGQYVEARADDETGYFVLSNEPGSAVLELVMRAGGGVSDVLLAADVGKSLQVTTALGEGFQMNDARGRPLVLALGGSGIAAGPSLVRRRINDGDVQRTRVLVGVRTREEFGMRPDVEAWNRAGVNVLVCLSRDDQTIEGIPCAKGYVQDVLRSRAEALDLRGGFIFAVGADSLVDDLRRIAPELGLEPQRVRTNH